MKSWWRNLTSVDRDIVGLIILIITVIPILAGGCVFFNAVSNYISCQRYQTHMSEKNFVWDFWVGCLIETPDDSFADADKYMEELGRFWLFVDENK